MDKVNSYQQISQLTDAELQQVFGVRDFYVYEVDFALLSNGTTAQGSFTVQADSNFLWQYGAIYCDDGSDLDPSENPVIPMVSAVIKDTSSGRDLMSSGVPLGSMFGNGNLPFLLPTPRFFRAQTQVNVSLANFASAADYNIRLSFIGTKFFKIAQAI